MKLFIEREEENTPVQNASFIDYEVEDQYHEEVVEGLDTISKDSPEDCRINKDLNAREMSDFRRVINKHGDVFSNRPGLANFEGHKITVTTNKPIVTRPYKIPFLQRPKVSQEL